MGRVLYWIAVIPLFLVVIVFAVTNHGTAELSLWPVLTEPVPFPVYGIALIALFLGFVLGGIVSWFQNGRTRRHIRELQRRAETEQRDNSTLRDRLARFEAAERQATIPPAPETRFAAVPAYEPVAGGPLTPAHPSAPAEAPVAASDDVSRR